MSAPTGVSAAPQLSTGPIAVSTDALPERERMAIFCEEFARQVLRLHVEPEAEMPFRANMSISRFPGFVHVSQEFTPVAVNRTKELTQDGDDRLVMFFADAPLLVRQAGRDCEMRSGTAVAKLHAVAGGVTLRKGGTFSSLIVPAIALRTMLRGQEDCLGRTIRADLPALRLLRTYLANLSHDSFEGAPEVQRLAATHVYDLMALALGATRDAEEIARGRGVAVAHLQAIKNYVSEHLGQALSLQSVAAHHRITPRYVQRLFERDGRSFTEFVNGRRLEEAHRMLLSARFSDMTIATIAYQSGFNDLSYFNRQFRARYHATPSDVRQLAISLK